MVKGPESPAVRPELPYDRTVRVLLYDRSVRMTALYAFCDDHVAPPPPVRPAETAGCEGAESDGGVERRGIPGRPPEAGGLRAARAGIGVAHPARAGVRSLRPPQARRS